jgi:opacity protein-like surface antigen
MRRVQQICTFFTVLLGLGLAMPGVTSAQSVAEARGLTGTAFLGGSMGLDRPGAGNSLLMGGAVGFDLTPNIGFEGELAHLFDVAGDNAGIDWSVTTVTGNFVYHFDVRHVTPYATFGLGFERSSVDVKVSDPVALIAPSATELTFNFGGGVKYRLAQQLLLRGDLRRVEANDLAPDYWRAYAGLVFQFRR